MVNEMIIGKDMILSEILYCEGKCGPLSEFLICLGLTQSTDSTKIDSSEKVTFKDRKC